MVILLIAVALFLSSKKLRAKALHSVVKWIGIVFGGLFLIGQLFASPAVRPAISVMVVLGVIGVVTYGAARLLGTARQRERMQAPGLRARARLVDPEVAHHSVALPAHEGAGGDDLGLFGDCSDGRV